MKRKKPRLKLAERDTVLTAWPTYCHGPGWANSPIWLIVRDGNGRLREECLQPEEQTAEMQLLFAVCATAHAAMMNEVRKMVKQ